LSRAFPLITTPRALSAAMIGVRMIECCNKLEPCLQHGKKGILRARKGSEGSETRVSVGEQFSRRRFQSCEGSGDA
jgi:hypothetical protein